VRRVGPRGVVHVGVGDDIGDRHAPARPQDVRRLAEYPRLVPGQVDDAVGDHDVDARVGQRQLLEVALDELDVVDARSAAFAPEVEHPVGRVQADHATARPDPPRADQHVRTRPTGAEVEHDVAVAQTGDRRRHAASQRRLDGSAVGSGDGVVARAAEHLATACVLDADGRRSTTGRPPPRRNPTAPRRRSRGRRGVALADELAGSLSSSSAIRAGPF
jgi:hypothetical protein